MSKLQKVNSEIVPATAVVKALPTKDTSFVFHSCDGVLLAVISTDAGYLR